VDVQDRARYLEKGFGLVSAEMVEALTARVDDLEENHRISYEGWATPGATQSSACLDLARAACRRAERAVIECRERGIPVSAEVVQYLNRLSDLCWLWARFVETKHAPSP
jgi:cob(I)alamin adenosyltransferase